MRGLYEGTPFAAAADDGTAAGMVLSGARGAVGTCGPTAPVAPLRRRAGMGVAARPLFTTVHSLREHERLAPPFARSSIPNNTYAVQANRETDPGTFCPTPPLHLVERGPGGEASPVPPRGGGTIGGPAPTLCSLCALWPKRLPRSPPGRCLSPTPRRYAPTDGDWQMQDLPGAPGTARQGRTRIIVSTNDGGKVTQPRAPGHERPLTAQRAARHGRLSAALRAPGADVPLAMTAGAPGHHRLRAAPIATAALPASVRRLRQAVLPRVPANPRTPIYLPSLQDTAAQTRAAPSHAPTYPPSHHSAAKIRAAYSHASTSPQSRSTTHQVHPAIQVPPRPRSCSTAGAGCSPQPHPRAPPAPCPSFPRKRESRHTPANPVGAPRWLRRQRLRYDAASCLVLLPGRAR